MFNLINFLLNSFEYKPKKKYSFTIDNSETCSNPIKPISNISQNVFLSLDVNLEYIKEKFNYGINSDIKIREFTLNVRNKVYKAFLLYIDGMTNTQTINKFILQPLMLKSKANMFNQDETLVNYSNNNSISIKKVKKFNLSDYIFNCLIPHNEVNKYNNFYKIITSVNIGNCALFVDTLETAFVCDVKGFDKRSISHPVNEIVIRGSQEAFVETIRTNTSILRRLVNNENLVIEDSSVGIVSRTRCSVCYINGIANTSLIEEVKHRINNLDIDYIVSSGQLEGLLKQNSKSSLPEVLSTERPDKATSALLEGKVIILVSGTPMALIVPCTFFDLLESSEDQNLNYKFANLLKLIRFIACFVSVLLPGLYIAITGFHEELIPTELLFSIISSREAVPISIALEIIIMEIAFELIHEAGIRVPSPISSTMSIVGALVLGDAAVSANIVSPISIIIVAISGLTSFAIPNYSLELHFRMLRFLFIFFGLAFGFLGISIGLFLYLILLSSLSSFGVPYLSPYAAKNNNAHNGYFLSPIWKREKRSDYLNTKRENKEAPISMKWKNN